MSKTSRESAETTGNRVRRYWKRYRWVLLTTIGVFAVEAVGRWLLAATVGLGVRPTGAVLALSVVLFGTAAAPGIFLGTLLAGLTVTAPVTSLVSAVAVTFGVLVGGRAVAMFDPSRANRRRMWAIRYVFVTTCAVCLVAAAAGVLSADPFWLVAWPFLAANLPLALAVGPVPWYTVRRTGLLGPGHRGTESVTGWVDGSDTPPGTRRRAALLASGSVGWLVAGYTADFFFGATERVPAERIGDRLVPAAARLLELVGPRGVVAQTLLGVGALVVLYFAVGRSR